MSPYELAAYVLAAVLVVAGIAKIRRPQETANDFAELGLSKPELLARLVPVAEFGCAALLVIVPPWGGIAGFALLAGFSAVLIGVLRSGRVVACRCFGALSSKPISPLALLRNAGLLLLASLAVLA